MNSQSHPELGFRDYAELQSQGSLHARRMLKREPLIQMNHCHHRFLHCELVSYARPWPQPKWDKRIWMPLFILLAIRIKSLRPEFFRFNEVLRISHHSVQCHPNPRALQKQGSLGTDDMEPVILQWFQVFIQCAAGRITLGRRYPPNSISSETSRATTGAGEYTRKVSLITCFKISMFSSAFDIILRKNI